MERILDAVASGVLFSGGIDKHLLKAVLAENGMGWL
jgi:hypothetical protein